MAAKVKKNFLFAICMLKTCLVGWLVVSMISITPESVAHAVDPNSIANERVPVKAEQLESHWKVNCSLTSKQTLLYLENRVYQRETEQKLLDNLNKCRFIYNMPDSVHYKPKPDYQLLLKKLGELYN